MEETRKKKVFIAFEGVDGSGKGTQLGLFVKHLERSGVPSKMIKQTDSNNIVGMMTRWLYGQKIIPLTPWMRTYLISPMISLDNRVSRVKKAFRNHEIKIGDRSLISNYAYSIAHSNNVQRDLRYLNLVWAGEKPPDVVVYFRLHPEIAMQRILSRGGKLQTHEELDFLKNVDSAFEQIISKRTGGKKFENTHFIKIEVGDRSPEDIHKEVVELLKPYLQAEGDE